MKTRIERLAVVMLVFVLAIALSQEAQAQTFKKVPVQGKAKMMQVASGGMSVWGLATTGQPYIYKGSKFALANTISLTQIAVGGGNLRQPDMVWGLDAAGNIYNAVKSRATWVFNQMPGNLDLINVGIGYNDSCHPYEVWGLNSAALIYRFNFCINNWEQIPGTLQTIATGGGEVWGANGLNTLFYFDFQSLTFRDISPRNGVLPQVTAGPDSAWSITPGDGHPVGIFGAGSGPYAEFDNLVVSTIEAGGGGVWALSSGGNIYLLHNLSFLLIPGNLTSVSVGSGAGVWGINGVGEVYAFSTP